MGLERCLVTKHTGCFCRGPRFGTQYTYGNSHCLTLVPGNSTPYSGLCRHCMHVVHLCGLGPIKSQSKLSKTVKQRLPQRSAFLPSRSFGNSGGEGYDKSNTPQDLSGSTPSMIQFLFVFFSGIYHHFFKI